MPRRYNVSKLPDLTDDFKVQGAILRTVELFSLMRGERGRQKFIDHVRITGTLLATLTDEEYHVVCREIKSALTDKKSRGKLPSEQEIQEQGKRLGLF